MLVRADTSVITPEDGLLTASAAELARRIRNQEVTSTRVVEAHIQRIKQVNPHLNAVVTTIFDQARAQAKQVDDYIADNGTDNVPPLLGVPITIKDCFAVKGVRFTAGSWFMRDNIAEEDAVAVRRLRQAGAIVLGKTNLPDMSWMGETDNPIFGRTNNPWNLKCTAGGSSGGEGAIIAAGGSPLGLGADIAGSVRIPAAANGIVSLKPTGGRISTEGHIPKAVDAIKNWNTAGPMARRVEDLALALSVLSETPVTDYRTIALENRQATVFIYNRMYPVQREVAETVLMAAGALQSAGMRVVRDDSLPLQSVGFAYTSIFEKENTPILRREIGGGRDFNLLNEFRASIRGHSDISRLVLWYMLTLRTTSIGMRRFGFGNFNRLEKLKQQILKAMTPGGVLLTPLLVTEPPKHGWTWTLMTKIPYTIMFNAMEFPAVVVPIRFSKRGLPLAVQVVAQPGEDEVALAVAAELERVFGGWQMAPVL